MDKTKKITIGLYVFSIFLILGISYAYFSLNIIGNYDAKLSVITAGTLELTYVDNDEITLDNIIPGDSIQKEITVKNTGTLDTMYNIIWQELNNKFLRNELVISATCERLNSEGTIEGTCNNIEEKPVARLSIPQKISIEAGITHKYTVTIKFIDTGKNQNYNKGKSFSGKLGIKEYIDNTPEATYCTFDGELTEGAEYVNGQYTYRYKQETNFNETGELIVWHNISNDGWGVQLTDKDSTDAVTTTPCTYINDKPVVSMSFMFYGSSASSIDLSKVNTRNVTNMSGMFASSAVTAVDLSNFDTCNVTDMYGMFANSVVTAVDLSSFDTRNVTNMSYMFSSSAFTTIDLSSFDTSNVTNMSAMFYNSAATILDLSSFDTSNVTNMSAMFYNSAATILDLSSFDTRNVTNMSAMFASSQATSLDVSNFNTSNVTDMSGMFASITVATVDLSSFDTSNVTDMRSMFYNSAATILDLSSFNTRNVINMNSMFEDSQVTAVDLSNFDTRNVTDMSSMFQNSKVNTLDLSSFDTRNVTNMGKMFMESAVTAVDLSNFDTRNVINMSSMFYNSQVTTLDLSSFDTSNVTDMNYMFYNTTLSKLKTIYATDKFVTTNVTAGNNMFDSCISLVGGQGTKYNSSYTDKTYARIDGGTSSPGYFTAK